MRCSVCVGNDITGVVAVGTSRKGFSMASETDDAADCGGVWIIDMSGMSSSFSASVTVTAAAATCVSAGSIWASFASVLNC